ncbi:Nicotinate dehydrogenase subunit B [subsurface metagenome]
MKEDEYIELDFTDITFNPHLTRREFMKVLGGGIVILFTIGDPSLLEARRRGRGYPDDFNAYLRIGADGRVSCFTGKVELGQGVVTSLAQMLADELDVTLDSVDMVMGDTSLCPWDMGTFGSMSTRFFGPPLRAAAAEARAVLIELAAEHLKVPKGRLKAKDGIIFDKTQNKNRVTYAKLAKGKAIARRAKEKPPLKTPSEFNIMGKDALRRDALEKVAGKAEFAGDIRLPGMLYARILRPPAHGAKLSSVDTSAVEKIAGVQLVRDGDFIAVLHKNPDEAENALTKIKAQFDMPEAQVDDESIFEHLVKNAPRRNVVDQSGDIEKGEPLALAK